MSQSSAFDRLFPVAYACSGAAGLLYEVAWSRLLTLRMGHTASATGTLLAAFMGGLALGAALISRKAATLERKQAAQLYALLEVLAAGLALTTLALLDRTLPWLASWYRNGDGGAPFLAARLVMSLVLLTLPAVAMGATLPIAIRAWGAASREGIRRANLLYALNTAGAAAGSLVTGFLLLPALGMGKTIWIGAALNLLAGGAAWWLSRSIPEAAADDSRQRSAQPAAVDVNTRAVPSWIPALAVSLTGAVSLIWEVAWSRLLALIVGPTTYAMSTMLTTFIVGLAIGAMLGTKHAQRTARPMFAAAIALVATAGVALVAIAAIDRVVLMVAGFTRGGALSSGGVVATEALLVGALLLPMAVTIGGVFPLAVAAAGSVHQHSRTLGTLYALNTFWAIVGALGASLVLVPALGIQQTIVLGSWVCAAAAAILALATSSPRSAAIVVAGAASVAVAGIIAPGWNRELLMSGAYKYAATFDTLDVESALTVGSLIYYREGAAGTVAVKEAVGIRSLVIDGKVDASNGADMLTQSLLAHVPLLLHPAPRRAAVIGLGSGVTVGAALAHPIERVDVLEISPEVVEASRYFARENRGALEDARTHLVIGDGRSHLQLTDTRYDVIISEPSNPWMAGVAALFTREFVEAARARLSPGGIVCQWAHTYDLDPADLRSIVRTFLDVFPDAGLWLVGEGDLLLVGSDRSLQDALGQVGERWQRERVGDALAAVKVFDVASLLSLYVSSGQALARFAGDAPLQTDDRLQLEFSAPLAMYERHGATNAEALMALREMSAPPAAMRQHMIRTPVERRNRGLMLAAAGDQPSAFHELRASVTADPDDRVAMAALLDAGAATGLRDELEGTLASVRRSHPRAIPPRLAGSRLAAASGDLARALHLVGEALEIDDTDADAQEQLAAVLADTGDPSRLAPVVAQLAAMRPDAPPTLYFIATLRFLRGDLAGALEAGRRAAASPSAARARALALVGVAHASLGQPQQAEEALMMSLAEDPRDPDVHLNLGKLHLQRGQLADAATSFSQALIIAPNSAAARAGLADVLDLQGHRLRARTVRTAALP